MTTGPTASSSSFGVNELKMHYGAPFHKWHQWRDPAPHQVDRFDEMKWGVFGLLDRSNLLDLLRNFIVFETEDGKTVKKVARYQQFRAANKLVARALQLGKPRGWRRGIVWHTQGSGKSLTILFVARKLWSLVDEAHRTQYGELAIGMRKLLPQASMFSFTGTPL